MFPAAYTVSGLKKSSWWDDAVLFFQENSQLIPTYYPLTSGACSKLLQGISVNLPGFENEKFRFKTTLLRKIQNSKAEIKIKTKIGSTSMKGGNNKGVKFAYPVAWQTSMKKKYRYCSHQRKSNIWKNYRGTEKGAKIKFRDPFGNQ